MRDRLRGAVLVLVVLSLLCAPVSWIDDGVTPSWVVYPTALLVGLWRFRSGRGLLFFAIAAAVFWLVHLPWSWAAVAGDENPLDETGPFNPEQWIVTLFLIPLALAATAGVAWWRERQPASPT